MNTCEDCDNVHPDTRKQHWKAWRCMKFPMEPGGNFVSPAYLPDIPLNRCSNINKGHCPLHTKRPNGQRKLKI